MMRASDLKKITTRFSPILLNGFRSILNPVLSILFSYIIVANFSKELWGNFVAYLLFFFIISLISNWGSKTYLMRAFSQNPKNMTKDWQQLFIARLPICLICIIAVPFIYDLSIAIYIILWVLSAFIYLSFLPIIFYNREYYRMIWIEIISFLVLLSLIYIERESLTSDVLVKGYAIHVLVKALLASISYKDFLNFKTYRYNLKLVAASFPFFLLGISGFLQSKIDVYTYSFYYQGEPLGEYQIVSGFIIFSQSFIMLLLFPYIKNIYRMSSKSINLLKKNMALYGLIINSIIVTCIYFMLLLFDIKLSLIQVILGFIIGYPCYIYTLDVLVFFKEHKEHVVIKISVVSLTINFLLSMLLLHLNYNITGVLAANAIAQIFSLYFYLALRKSRNSIKELNS